MNRDSFMSVFEYLEPPMWIYLRRLCRAAMRAGNEMSQHIINKNINKAAYLLANAPVIMKDRWNLCFICKTIIFDDGDKSSIIKCSRGCGRQWCRVHSTNLDLNNNPSKPNIPNDECNFTKITINNIQQHKLKKMTKRQKDALKKICCHCTGDIPR